MAVHKCAEGYRPGSDEPDWRDFNDDYDPESTPQDYGDNSGAD